MKLEKKKNQSQVNVKKILKLVIATDYIICERYNYEVIAKTKY